MRDTELLRQLTPEARLGVMQASATLFFLASLPLSIQEAEIVRNLVERPLGVIRSRQKMTDERKAVDKYVR